MFSIPEDIRIFLRVNSKYMAMNCGCSEDLCISEGELAYWQAVSDGEALDSYLSVGAKRYIRREMLRAGAPTKNIKLTSLIDYRYLDGRSVNLCKRKLTSNLTRDKKHRYKMMSLGKCPICGKDACGKHLCAQCSEKKNSRRRKYHKRVGGRSAYESDSFVLLNVR
jgi:hypothetical protein